MNLPILICIVMGINSLPYYLIPEIIFTKYLIHKNLHIMSDVPIQMYIDRGSIAHNGLYCHKVLIHPIQIAFLIPHITIHLFFKVTQFFAINLCLGLLNSLCHFWITTNINLLGIIGTTCKRWVNINKVYFHSLIFKISASRKALTPKHEVMIRILAHHFLTFYFVERHTTQNSLKHFIVITIKEFALWTGNYIEYSLSCKDIEGVGNIFDCHNEFFYLKN